jgi:hypothetical protein
MPIDSIEYLDLAQDILKSFVPPATLFDPNSAWSHRYKIFTLVSGTGVRPTNRNGGSLKIERSPREGGGSILTVDYVKTTQWAGTHKISAQLTCAGDPIATPLAWSLEFTACPPPHGPALPSQKSLSGKHLPVKPPHTTNWSLFEAVQRMPRREGPALRFTLFDPCDVPKPNQVLSFYKTAQLAGRWPKAPNMLVHGFLQIGQGISPQVYWVDDTGRLLFLIAGIDAYVLQAS